MLSQSEIESGPPDSEIVETAVDNIGAAHAQALITWHGKLSHLLFILYHYF
jgi:hypothetical protein